MEYNPFSLEIHINPYPTYKVLRDEEPLYHNPELGFWALTRFEDVWQATHNWQAFSSSAGPSLEVEPMVPMMIAMDPPDHNLNRGIISKAFTPRKIRELEPQITEIICGYLDQLQERDSFDAVEDFSAKFPMDVISTLLGIPKEDRDMVRRWSNLGLSRTPGVAEPPPEAVEAGAKSWEYYRECIAQRRVNPRDDMMSALVQSKAKDSAGKERGLTEDELLGFVMLIAAAGNETLTKFFGNAVYHLNHYPNAGKMIAENEAVIPSAVEEILRFDPPSQYQGRIMLQDFDMYGQTIPAGDRAILVTGAASRDEREFDQPDVLDIERNIERQMALGHAHHLCLGASLARMEGKIALREFFRRFPNYTVDEDSLGYVHSSNVRGFTNVPVSVQASGA